ncbi:MAG TPA: aldolase/citrate lyase family protein [Gemmatimonadales bacterium]
MRSRLLLAIASTGVIAGPVPAQAPHRLNPVVELLKQNQPVFGVYAPGNRRGPARTAAQLAADALAYRAADYVFDGSMEDDFEGAWPAFVEFVNGMAAGGAVQKAPFLRLHHPLIVKTHMIAPDPAKAAERIGRQLNLGVSGIVFVGVESADEVKQGLAAMRFRFQGGTRPDDVGGAPAYWGMSEPDYKEKADLWPLNPRGELINWTIVESKEGLAQVREIAAVPGIGVLFPGAGTLRRVFSTTDANGQRTLDAQAWEAAIQQVLAACKEFRVPCGYPATADDIELRMKQGFSVFVINWGDAGFKAVEVGRRVAGR